MLGVIIIALVLGGAWLLGNRLAGPKPHWLRVADAASDEAYAANLRGDE